MLTCKQATFYSSVKNFRKLPFVRSVQLKMHLMMCESCHEFDHQSQVIDQSMLDLHQNLQLQSEEQLTEEKKSEIEATVKQAIK